MFPRICYRDLAYEVTPSRRTLFCLRARGTHVRPRDATENPGVLPLLDVARVWRTRDRIHHTARCARIASPDGRPRARLRAPIQSRDGTQDFSKILSIGIEDWLPGSGRNPRSEKTLSA